MQDRHLCWPPTCFLGPAVPPNFFNSRIATATDNRIVIISVRPQT